MRPLLRLPLIATALAAPLLAAGPAAAQTDGGGTTLSSGDFFIGVQHQPGANLSDFDRARFFNKAHCDCTETVYVYTALTDSGFQKRLSVDRTGEIQIWVGSGCDQNDSGRTLRCDLIDTQTMATFLNNGRLTSQTNARELSTYTNAIYLDGGTTGNFTPNPTCTSPTNQAFPQTIFVITTGSTGSPVALATTQLNIDLTPPPAPDSLGITVEAGNEAVVIKWPKVDSSVYTDLLGYQVLCNRAGDLQVFSDGTFGAGFQECAMPGTDAGVGLGVNDGGVNGLDPRFVCSPLLSATTESFRVKILQNDITYGVAVVSIDISGNASTPDIFYKAPIKTKSFYDVYREGGYGPEGAATGGLCTLGEGTTSRGAAKGVAAALALAAIVIGARRRRRR